MAANEERLPGEVVLEYRISPDDERYHDVCRLAAIKFLDECSLEPKPDAVDQLVDAFLPCLEIMCKRGYDPNGANWRAKGWRGLVLELNDRMRRLVFNSWDSNKLDINNASDIINFAGYYIRLKNEGPPFGVLKDPGGKDVSNT